MMQAITPLPVGDGEGWMAAARPRARIACCTVAPGGSLMRRTGPLGLRAAVQIRDAAWRQAMKGRAMLVQRRDAGGGTACIAITGRFDPPQA